MGPAPVRLNLIALTALFAAASLTASPELATPARMDALPMARQWTKTFDGQPPVSAAADAGRLLAGWSDHFDVYDQTSGERAWSLPIPATRAACDEGLCIVADDSQLRAIDLNTHAVRWQQPLAMPLNASPTLRSGWVLLTSATGVVRAIQAVDGREVWHFDAGAAIVGAPSINGTRVALSTTARRVTLLDIATGRGLWTTILDTLPGPPCLGGGDVIVGTEDGRLVTLSDADGRLRFEYRMGATVTGAPTLDDERIYTVGLDGVLRAFDRGNGAQRWYKNLETRAAMAPVVDGDLVMVALRSGVLDVRLNDGRVAARFAGPGPETTVRIALPPIIAGYGRTLSVLTVSADATNTDQWSLTRVSGGARLETSAWPAGLPGRSLTLTPPR